MQVCAKSIPIRLCQAAQMQGLNPWVCQCHSTLLPWLSCPEYAPNENGDGVGAHIAP